ncbi:MAG: flagellar biosynthesis protein FlhB [Trichloromonadaceae bacterium]
MAEDKDQERTEDATAKRRQDFRQKGQVAQSKEVHTAALFTVMLMLWYFYAPLFWRQFEGFAGGFWRGLAELEVTELTVMNLGLMVVGKVSLLLAPVVLLVLTVGFFSSYLQIGWLFTLKPFEPDLAKFNPITGLGRMVSKRSLVEMIKSLLKVLVVGGVAYQTVRGEFETSLLLIDQPPVETLRFVGHLALLVLVKSCGIMMVLGLVDFLYQRWDMEQKMKMTKQEQKEEYKQSEGDPYIKSKIRAIQQQMSRKRMLADVPKADVIITNPTHLSIAISYVRDEMDAPRIVAKGADHLALKIRELAREHRVPLVENIPVARALYQVELGQPIPEELFKAVAEILAYVYSLKGTHPGSH